MKNLIITGGATGLGKLLALHYAKHGYNVYAFGIQSPSEVSYGVSNIFYFKVDVTSQSEMQTTVQHILKEASQIDLAIACAGLNMPKDFFPDLALGRKVLEVNIFGVINLFEALAPFMREKKQGHFVAISSLSALNGLPGMSYYGASKNFLINFFESLACDTNNHGIHFTTLIPGFIKTEFVKNNKHKMPFLLTPEKALLEMTKAIDKKIAYKAFPLIPFLFMRLLSVLPRSLYLKIMEKDILKLKN